MPDPRHERLRRLFDRALELPALERKAFLDRENHRFRASARYRGSGLIVVNPPWRLADELAVLLPALGRILSRGAACRTTLDWLSGESPLI